MVQSFHGNAIGSDVPPLRYAWSEIRVALCMWLMLLIGTADLRSLVPQPVRPAARPHHSPLTASAIG